MKFDAISSKLSGLRHRVETNKKLKEQLRAIEEVQSALLFLDRNVQLLVAKDSSSGAKLVKILNKTNALVTQLHENRL